MVTSITLGNEGPDLQRLKIFDLYHRAHDYLPRSVIYLTFNGTCSFAALHTVCLESNAKQQGNWQNKRGDQVSHGILPKLTSQREYGFDPLSRERLVPLLIFLFVFFFFFLILFVVKAELVSVFILIVFGNELHRVHASDTQCSSALITREHIAFVQVFFFNVDRRIAFWAADHTSFPL